MATEWYNFTGHAAWAKVYETDNSFGRSQWQIDIFPEDDEQWEKFKKSQIQKKVKENTEPNNGVPIGKYVSFTRDSNKVIKGEMVNFTGPVIERDDGTVIIDYVKEGEEGKEYRVSSYSNKEKSEIYRRGEPVLIGNGSRVTVNVAVYDTQKGKGQRLDKITIHDLVEYERAPRELPPVANDVRKSLGEVTTSDEEVEETTDAPW